MERKRKRSSRSSQVYDSRQFTPPTSSTNEAEVHRQPVSVGEGNEMPERKKRMKQGFERVEDQATYSAFEVFPPANNVQTSPSQVQLNPASELDVTDEDDILSRYDIGPVLGEGRFGVVYEGRRLEDDLEVAVKITRKQKKMEYIIIPGHPKPLPLEVGLLILVNEGPSIPEIIQLLDWQDQPDRYIMILEHPSPCEDLVDFVERHGDALSEDIARTVMLQATRAAHMCCLRGVFHRDIKLDNLLINPETLKVKLTDFGCGDLLKESGYDVFCGTAEYFPPEYGKEGRYHGKPATVWSLGVLLFTIVTGRFPDTNDLQMIEDNIWSEPGLQNECCHLIRSLLQRDPSQRISLGKIIFHKWFKQPERVTEVKDSQQRKSKKISFDRKGCSDETKWTTVTIGQKRKRSSPSAQLSDSSSLSSSHSVCLCDVFERTTSKSSSDVVEHHQSDKDDEGPERKRRRTESVQEVSSLVFFDRRGQSQALQVQDQAAVLLNWRNAEEQNPLQDINCAIANSGPEEPLSSRSEVCPNEDQQNILSQYEIGQKLGEGGFGDVYEGKRLADGLQVAIKFARKQKDSVCINIAGYPVPLPVEVGLLLLVSKDPKVPQIIELLDWQDQLDQYIMVLERPSPCEDLWEYVHHCGGTLNEDIARLIMWQATYAAHMCCQRGVFHRDIKLDNILINIETLEVKLIDFGCGDLLRETEYDVFCGTPEYFPPEYNMDGRYQGKPATVWSLGVLLFAMLRGCYPKANDLLEIGLGKCFHPDLSLDCCRLIQRLLQQDPKRRIGLDEILQHAWFTPRSSSNLFLSQLK